MPKFPVYDPKNDGNVFDWIMAASESYRQIRQQQRLAALYDLKKNDNQRPQ